MNILPPKDVNKVLKRPYYAMVTEEEVASRLSDSLRFTSPDVCSGYRQLQVDDQSAKLYDV